jgi:hypothetical protein
MDLGHPLRLIAIGGALLAVSWLVVFLIAIGVIAASVLLTFLAYAVSVAGLALGMLGAALYVRRDRS